MLVRKVNYQDEFEVEVQYPGSEEDFNIASIIFYFQEPVGVIIQKFTRFRTRIEKHYTEFDSSYIDFVFRISFYDPRYIVPAFSSYNMQINLPPVPGSLTITPASGDALSTVFTISTPGFTDPDAPLLYRFYYYLSPQDYEDEKEAGGGVFELRRVLLQDYQLADSISVRLPSGKIGATDNKTILVLV